MSTRCQIEFKHIQQLNTKTKKIVERRTIYRHSDGYPEGVIPDLKLFLKWNSGRNGDIEYQVANFIYWSKRRVEEAYFNKKYDGSIENSKLKWADNQQTNMSQLHTGFGICENDEYHCDIEYFYVVEREVSGKENKVMTKIIRYKVEAKDWSNPITKKNLKLVSETIIDE